MFKIVDQFILKSAKKRQPFRALFLALSLLLIFVGGNVARPTIAAPLLTCADITEIPAIECQALQAFVTANPTSGILASWFQTNTPCSWLAVSCGLSNAITSLTLVGTYSTNKLTTVPAEISNLTNLTSLDLYSNQVTTLPSEIGNLTKLTKLEIGNNQMTSLPAKIGNLTQLTNLSLHSNQITTLPAEIGNLTQLTNLTLSNNQITNLPAEIGNLTNLTYLNLISNQLTNLLSEIGNLTNLTDLWLTSNQITSVPAEIGNLTNLIWLSLADNQITSVPAEIGNLSNLTDLWLYSNQLTSVPAEISNLTNLTSLYLNDNPNLKGVVPSNYLNLQKLNKLSMSGTQLCVPDEPAYQSWIATLSNYSPSGVSCADLIRDSYEADDSCGVARSIPTNGTSQDHTFHDAGDADWVQFPVVSGTHYIVEGSVPSDSAVDLIFELYRDCSQVPFKNQGNTFSPGVLIDFTATETGFVYLGMSDQAGASGNRATYGVSVREVLPDMTGAVIIVAGLLRVNDLVQPNIDEAAMRIYRMFIQHGYSADNIYFLARTLSLDADKDGVNDVDALATVANFQSAVTSWSLTHLPDDTRPLNLYLMDHGSYDTFYINEPLGHRIAPNQLDEWIDQVEAVRPNLKVNIILEMCRAGSFIEGELSVSKDEPNRIVIASSGAFNDAWASRESAIFTDYLIAGLDQLKTLANSFQEAREAVLMAKNGIQTPWIDGNGDGIPNQSADFDRASERGFGIPGSFYNILWPPYIESAESVTINDRKGNIVVTVEDDDQLSDTVWAVIYAPSYQPPAPSDTLVSEILPTLVLVSQGNNQYAAQYTGFDEVGTYRIVVYAQDKDDLQARPYAFEVVNGVPTGVGLAQVETTSAAPTIIVMLLPILLGVSYLFAKKRRA